MNNHLLRNENEKDYCIILGEYHKPALLCRLNNEPRPYIVCQMLSASSWYNGSYFEDFYEAYKAYKELAK